MITKNGTQTLLCDTLLTHTQIVKLAKKKNPITKLDAQWLSKFKLDNLKCADIDLVNELHAILSEAKEIGA